MDVVIVTGMSGAGKSKAADALEDIGYFCIDNMPPLLIPQFVTLSQQSKTVDKIAVVTDVRGGALFKDIYKSIEQLKLAGIKYKILFFDAEDDVIARRYKETRRKHPLSAEGDISVEDAIKRERSLLQPLYEISDYVIDTSFTSVAQERERIISLFLNSAHDAFRVTVLSFGFKYGLPAESDLVLDVRCLLNPFYVDSLKNGTGLDKPVIDYIFSDPESEKFMSAVYAFLDTALPMYVKEGKSELVISVGCTGGRHRSVAIAELINRFIGEKGYCSETAHRDIYKLL